MNWIAHSTMPSMHCKMQNAQSVAKLPVPAAFERATEQACRSNWMMATSRLPRLIEPKLYVKALRAAPRVAPFGGLLGAKNHAPYTPEIVVWIVFLSHSVIQYAANVMKTMRPITIAELQFPPALHAGLFPGSYLTYTATRVTLKYAPNAAAMRPPINDTRYTWPNFFDTSIAV